MSGSQIRHGGLIVLRQGGVWRGALIEGPSGVGKSDLALRALDAGFRLVADDRVVVFATGGRLYGKPPEPLAGLIVESSFTSAFGVLPVTRIMPFDKFPSRARIAKVACPVLVIHGRRDEVIPFAHGEALLAALAPGVPRQHLWLDEAHHNDVPYVGGEAYRAALREFAALVQSRQRL